MDVFYPADEIEVVRQMLAFFCWAWAVRYGCYFADWHLRVWKEFFQFLRQLLHRSRKPRP